MRVAVVGAGASGLTAIKCLKDEGLDVVCFERTNYIGGLWRYTDEAVDGQGSVNKYTVINTSKEMMSFSDFPIPEEYPVFMHNRKVLDYFRLYASEFDLEKHIRFQTKVCSITRDTDYEDTGRWRIVSATGDEAPREEVYDAVLLCSGHHADKNTPTFPDQHLFKGKITHSHDYRHPTPYTEKEVLVVGIGNSGGDCAVELGRVAKQVYLSTRRGSWVFNRIADDGKPGDMIVSKRITQAMAYYIGLDRINNMIIKQLNARFDHAKYGLQPEHKPLAQHPTVNDELPNRIINGLVQVRPDIRRFTEDGVVFTDGTSVKVDDVILATGYTFGFPFLEKGIIETAGNQAPLYKYVFPPKLPHATLGVIGFVQPTGAIMPLAELQCRWAARLFTKQLSLPSQLEMQLDMHYRKEAMSHRYVSSQRHTIQVDYVDYACQIAELIGCKPQLLKLLLSDWRLFREVVFGPCTPYQFRLHGPGAWDGARTAILTQWERTYAALNHRTRGQETAQDSGQGSGAWVKVILVALTAYLIYWLLY